jgi:hypothetical protein
VWREHTTWCNTPMIPNPTNQDAIRRGCNRKRGQQLRPTTTQLTRQILPEPKTLHPDFVQITMHLTPCLITLSEVLDSIT